MRPLTKPMDDDSMVAVAVAVVVVVVVVVDAGCRADIIITFASATGSVRSTHL